MPRAWSRSSGRPASPIDRMLDWTADWLSRGMAEPRQADALRGARWPFLTRLRRARGGRSSACSREMPRACARCRSKRAGTRWRPTGVSCWTWGGASASGAEGPMDRERAGAAARTDHLLDQHGAGDPAGAGPRPRHAPAVALHRRGRGERRRRGPRCHRAGSADLPAARFSRRLSALALARAAGVRHAVAAGRHRGPRRDAGRPRTHLRLRSLAQRL